LMTEMKSNEGFCRMKERRSFLVGIRSEDGHSSFIGV